MKTLRKKYGKKWKRIWKENKAGVGIQPRNLEHESHITVIFRLARYLVVYPVDHLVTSQSKNERYKIGTL